MRTMLFVFIALSTKTFAQEQTFSFNKREKTIVLENAMSKITIGPYQRLDKRTEMRVITVDTAMLYSNVIKLAAGKIQRINDKNNNLVATVFLYGPEGTLNKLVLPSGKEFLWSTYGTTVTYSSGGDKAVCKYDADSKSFKLETSTNSEKTVPPIVQIVALEQGLSHIKASKVPLGVTIGLGVLLALIRVVAME